jgi:dipeptidyl aminopeptidase/acylaminoacyl peptidase
MLRKKAGSAVVAALLASLLMAPPGLAQQEQQQANQPAIQGLPADMPPEVRAAFEKAIRERAAAGGAQQANEPIILGLPENLPPEVRAAIEKTLREDAARGPAAGGAPRTIFIGTIPTSYYAAQPEITMLALSPDGKRVAGVKLSGADTLLVVMDTAADAAAPKAINLGKHDVSMLRWASPTRLLFVSESRDKIFKVDERGIYMEGAPRLYGVNGDLSNLMMFFRGDKKLERENLGVPDIVSMLSGDPDHVLLPLYINQGRLGLFKVDINTGAYEQVASGESHTIHWFADRNGEPAIRLDANPRRTSATAYFRVSAPGEKLSWRKGQTFRLQSGTSRIPDFIPVRAGPVPTQYYVIARPPGANTLGVYLYDMKQDSFVETLFSDPQYDVDDAVFDPATGAYVGAFYWEDIYRFRIADVAYRAKLEDLDKKLGGGLNLRPLDQSDDGRFLLVLASSAHNSGSYHIYDSSNGTVRDMGKTRPYMERLPKGDLRAITYTARDGSQLRGYVTHPINHAPGSKAPLVVLPHGGPEARDYSDFSPMIQFLAARGYAVFQPQFRGSGGFGLAFSEAGHGRWADIMQTDVSDGVRQLIKDGFADPQRICIFGLSYGGYSALMGPLVEPDLYKCAVSASGVSDLARMLRWQRNEEGSSSSVYQYWVGQIGDPDKDKAAIAAASPALMADRYNVPVLLIHGAKDPIVPVEQSHYMRDALKKAGKPVEYVEFEYGIHGFENGYQHEGLTALEKFFATHLGGAAPN